MQQYFSQHPIQVGDKYVFTKEQAHHARDVVRLDHEKVRIVADGIGYFGICYSEGKNFVADIQEKDERINESEIELTLAMALIRREKFELVLQKAAELGVSRIVPFESSRCVVHAKAEKADKQMNRWADILREGAAQCKRNRIPEIQEVCRFKDLKSIDCQLRMAAYENAYGNAAYITDVLMEQTSACIVIGPEGGFSEEEVKQLQEDGFIPVTFGSRILRAETAAMYGCSVIAEAGERRKRQ